MEHFLDIHKEMNVIKQLLNKNGVLYIELPGVYNLHFSYECDFLESIQNAHTYYFTLETLKQIMRLNGFDFINGDEIVRSLFKISMKSNTQISNFYFNIKQYLKDLECNRGMYLEKYYERKKSEKEEFEQERKIKFKRVNDLLSGYKDKGVMIYGCGGHTRLLLDFLDETNKILGLLDNDREKINKIFYGYTVMDMCEVVSNIEAIVISSDAYQEIIYDRIKSYEKNGIDIIKIY